jgi:hypothetical protein
MVLPARDSRCSEWTRPRRARESLGIGEIDGAELLSAGQRGVVIDGMADGRKRTVQAALLRECCHELKDRIDPRGLRLSSVIVTGGLDLTGLVVPFPLRFEGCEFDTAPMVEGAQLFELALTGSPRLPGLLGNGVRLRRDLERPVCYLRCSTGQRGRGFARRL